MSYAYLVVTLDVSARPPRVVGSQITSSSGKTLPHQDGRFHCDVMMASGRTFDLAKRNLLVMSKVPHFASQTTWAFQMLPEKEYGEWLVAPRR